MGENVGGGEKREGSEIIILVEIFKSLKRIFLSHSSSKLILSCIVKLPLPGDLVYQHGFYQHIPRGKVHLKP